MHHAEQAQTKRDERRRPLGLRQEQRVLLFLQKQTTNGTLLTASSCLDRAKYSRVHCITKLNKQPPVQIIAR